MYLKEGDIGKAESEEVVPVKTETEVVSQGCGLWHPESIITVTSNITNRSSP